MNKSDGDEQKKVASFFRKNRGDSPRWGVHTFLLNRALLRLNPALHKVILSLHSFHCHTMTVKLLLLIRVCFIVCHWLVTREPWSDKERQLLQEGVRQFIGESRSSLKSFQYLPWTTVSNYVGTRSWSQCRLKWSVGMCGRLFTLSFSTLNVEAVFTTVAVSLTSWHHVFLAFPRISALEVPPCGAGAPLFPLVHLLHLFPFYFFLSFIGFTYFLLLSIPSLSTRIVPLRFQAGGCRRRPNLGLVCVLLCNLCYLYSCLLYTSDAADE